MKYFMQRLEDRKNEKQQMGWDSLGNITCFQVGIFVELSDVSGFKYFQAHLHFQCKVLEFRAPFYKESFTWRRQEKEEEFCLGGVKSMIH